MQYVLQIAILFFSVIIHEVAHGFVAYKRGDDTAKVLGRLTLNPVVHIDMIGSIIMPALLIVAGMPVFGWAKPVPINIYKLKNPKRDILLVSIAGVAGNFFLAVAAALIMLLLRNFAVPSDSVSSVYTILYMTVAINVVLCVFNLIPVPPLDGSRILVDILPRDLAIKYAKLEPYGFLIILVLLCTGLLWKLISPVMVFLINLLIGKI